MGINGMNRVQIDARARAIRRYNRLCDKALNEIESTKAIELFNMTGLLPTDTATGNKGISKA